MSAHDELCDRKGYKERKGKKPEVVEVPVPVVVEEVKEEEKEAE